MSPGGVNIEENPFEAEFNDDEDEDEDVPDGGLDFTPGMPEDIGGRDVEISNFAVLNSSLPEQLPEQHHLTSYVSAKRSGAGAGGREKKQHRTKWHFGIRSRSPPMEVMLEIYRALKTLDMEWREKKNLGGLGGVRARRQGGSGGGIERAKDLDGNSTVDPKAAAGIYFVETRARVQDVVVCYVIYLPTCPTYLTTDIGADELTTLHGRLHKLPRGLPSQEII